MSLLASNLVTGHAHGSRTSHPPAEHSNDAASTRSSRWCTPKMGPVQTEVQLGVQVLSDVAYQCHIYFLQGPWHVDSQHACRIAAVHTPTLGDSELDSMKSDSYHHHHSVKPRTCTMPSACHVPAPRRAEAGPLACIA